MDEERLREEIRELVSPGSMTLDTIVEELSENYPKREVQITVVDMVDDGDLEGHPEFTDVYRVSE